MVDDNSTDWTIVFENGDFSLGRGNWGYGGYWWIKHYCGGYCSVFNEYCCSCERRAPKHMVLQLKILRS